MTKEAFQANHEVRCIAAGIGEIQPPETKSRFQPAIAQLMRLTS